MKLRKLTALALSTVIGMGTLASCGGSEPTTEGDATGDAAATESTDATEEVEFTLWHSYVGADARAAYMTDRLAAFQEAYPQYTINVQEIPRDQYQTKLRTEAAAGQLPDAFVIWPNAMTNEFATSGLLRDINPLLDENPEWKDSLVEASYQQFTVDDKTYSAGLGLSLTSVVYYNQAIFDEYGVTYPETYEDLLTAIDTFNAAGVTPIAFGNKPLWPAQSTIYSNLANRVTGSEWLDNAVAGTASFEDPEFISALNTFKQLFDRNAFNKDFNSIDEVQMRSYYYNGEAAMMIGGSWILPEMIENMPEEVKATTKLGILPAVEGGAGDPATISGVSATGIATSAKVSDAQAKAISDLVLFLTNEESQKVLAASNIPVSSKQVSLEGIELDPLYIACTDLISQYPLVDVYDSVLSAEATDSINNGLQGISIGAVTPEEVAKSLEETMRK